MARKRKYISILKMFLGAVACLSTSIGFADVYCEGKIASVYKWADFQTISIIVKTPEGNTNWISMPTKSDEAMALMAFSAGKTVKVRWGDGITDVTNCINGWVHNRKLQGWWAVFE